MSALKHTHVVKWQDMYDLSVCLCVCLCWLCSSITHRQNGGNISSPSTTETGGEGEDKEPITGCSDADRPRLAATVIQVKKKSFFLNKCDDCECCVYWHNCWDNKNPLIWPHVTSYCNWEMSVTPTFTDWVTNSNVSVDHEEHNHTSQQLKFLNFQKSGYRILGKTWLTSQFWWQSDVHCQFQIKFNVEKC